MKDNPVTTIVFSVTNCICFDQRVQKMTDVVRSLGCDVSIIGRKSGTCCERYSFPFRSIRFNMVFKRGFLFYKFFNIRLFIYLLFHRFDILVANDLDTLLPNYLVSKLKGLPLVYDSHEYFTGVPELNGRPFVKWVWKRIERNIFPHLKHVITVSDLIADQYEFEYGIRPAVVRNCSCDSSEIIPWEKEKLEINPAHLVLIFQGAGINTDRGGEELIESIKKTDGVTLLVAGSGDVINKLKSLTLHYDISDRIKFIPKSEWPELLRYTKMADAGLSLDKDTNMNYRFSLPNKLFDYISAGIPVIAGNLPEISKIVESYRCGLIIPEITPEEISKAIITLRDDKVLLNNLHKNSVIASESLNWEVESEKVKELYLRLLK